MKLNVTFLNKIKKIYSPCLVSVVHLAYFVVFEGFSGVCLQLSKDAGAH